MVHRVSRKFELLEQIKCTEGSFLKKLLTLFILVLLSVSVFAISLQDRDSILQLPLFKNDKLLEIELKTDLNALINDIGEKRNYHNCQLQLLGITDNPNKDFEVQVKTRGNFRRRKQNCNFPPLRFKIPTSKVNGTVFEGQRKLKYVSHCQSNIERYEQHTIAEYLIYKMYNLITDHSYRVRLSRVSFIDIITSDTIHKFGFFLEDRKDVAIRNGKNILQFKNIKQYNVLRTNMIMLSLFQLMIGNSDWDVERLHNIDIMSVDEQSIPMVVPFDFDWSGIINHTYFTLDPKIAPDAKYKRKYKGYRWSTEEFETAFSSFNELKESFFEVILTCQYLNEENKTRMVDYVLEFYELIGSKKDVKAVIEKNSLKIPHTR